MAGLGERRLPACVGKATAGYDIECGDFGLAGGTVGWELRVHPSSIERIDLFARDDFVFVAGFVFATSANREDAPLVRSGAIPTRS